MVVVVSEHGVRLDEPDDFTGFKVVVETGAKEQAEETLTAVGEMADRETAWIWAHAVRALAGDRVGDDWNDRFSGMLEYAAGKGWIRSEGPDDTIEIRAHVEWPP